MPGFLKIGIPAGRTLVMDKKALSSTMRMVGTELVQVTRALIRGGSGSKNRRTGTVSKPGEPPVSQSGDLLAGLSSRVMRSGSGVIVRDATYYAKFLETGAQGGAGSGRGAKGFKGRQGIRAKSVKHQAMRRILLPRPFLTKALEMRQDSLSQRVEAAIMEGIQFRRQKA